MAQLKGTSEANGHLGHTRRRCRVDWEAKRMSLPPLKTPTKPHN
jgi:hypothetical protein